MLNKLKKHLLLSLTLLFFVATIQQSLAAEPINIIPETTDVNKKIAALGKKIFFDTRLSEDGTFSCNTCHLLDKFGVDGTKTSLNSRFGKRNSPTLYNSRLNFKQLWDGRADDLLHQLDALKFVNWDGFLERLNRDSDISKEFENVFNKEISVDLIKQVIVEYEKTLVTPNSPFDQFLNGDETAISEQAKAGYKLFKNYGCVACHQGANVGGNIMQRFGVIKDIQLRDVQTNDFGRYNVTKKEWDKFVFKVPSLRLAVHTAPYFHDGSVATIEEAIDVMIEFQLQRSVPANEREDIIEFLKTLPGEMKY